MSKNKKIKFCYGCGAKFSKFANYVPYYCPNCGIQIRDNENIRQCAICHDRIVNVNRKAIKCSFCSNNFHPRCVLKWLHQHNTCPVCLNAYLKPINK